MAWPCDNAIDDWVACLLADVEVSQSVVNVGMRCCDTVGMAATACMLITIERALSLMPFVLRR